MFMQKSTNMKQNRQKKSGSYYLVKDQKIELNQFCTMHIVGIKDTQQYRTAKIFNPQIIRKYELQNNLQYNQQIFLHEKNVQYLLHLQQIFMKKGQIYMIHQFFQMNLVDFVQEQFPCVLNAQIVLNDVLSGIMQLYKLQYATRSLRPQHIVNIKDKWKIQSFVLNEKSYNIQSELCWSPQFASPEDRIKLKQLPQQQIDEQLIWNLGIIGLYMIIGPQFKYQNINKDQDIPWNQVKQQINSQLYDFLTRALKVNFMQRLKLKDLFKHKIFAERFKHQTSSPFLSYDQVMSEKNQKKVLVQSIRDEDVKVIQSLKDCIQHAKYFGQVEKYVQEIHFKKSFDVNLIIYLCFKISYDMLQQIKNSIGKQRRKIKILKQLQTRLHTQILQFKQKKQKYIKTLKDSQSTTSQVQEIRNMLQNKDMSDENIWNNKAIKIFTIMAGCIYSQITKNYKDISYDKQRTICFYSLAVYLLFYYDHEKFKNEEAMNYVQDGTLKLNKFINQGEIQYLIQFTQQLIKEHFVVDQKK